MIWQYQLFIILIPFAAATILVCIFTSWKWRFTPKGFAFIAGQFCALGFVIFNTLELMADTPAMTVFFMKISFIFWVLLPPVWLLFSQHYIGRPLYKKGWIFFIIPIFTLILIWTNESSGWFWTGYQFSDVNGMLAIRTEYGFWFMVNALYSHAIMISGTITILVYFTNFPKVYRYQTRLMAYGIAFPVLYNLLSISRILPIQKDFSPIALTFPAITFTISMIRYHMMDLTPISRTSVVEHLQDGVIIIDTKNRILDINQIARDLLQIESVETIGTNLGTFFPEWDNSSIDDTASSMNDKYLFKVGGKEHKYKLAISPYGEEKILIFRDVTETDKLVEDMQALAASDPITGLLNRRYFLIIGGKVFESSIRYKRQLSILMIDIDHFDQLSENNRKLRNEILCAFSNYCQQNLRNADMIARYGDDEFIVLLPETNCEKAYILAERLRITANTLLGMEEIPLPSFTLCIGISSLSTANTVVSLERLVEQAEQALHQAKRRGGNQSIFWK